MSWLKKALTVREVIEGKKGTQCINCLNYQWDEHTKKHICMDAPEGLSSEEAVNEYFVAPPYCPNVRR